MSHWNGSNDDEMFSHTSIHSFEFICPALNSMLSVVNVVGATGRNLTIKRASRVQGGKPNSFRLSLHMYWLPSRPVAPFQQRQSRGHIAGSTAGADRRYFDRQHNPELRPHAVPYREEIMIKQTQKMLCLVTVVVSANLVAACSGGAGPGESDLVAACLKEGESVIQKNRDKQMGVNRDTFCKCAAQEAKSVLTADGRRATLLGMQGKKEEARAITSKMSDSEQENHLKGGLLIMKKCMG